MTVENSFVKKPKLCFVCPYCYPIFNSQQRTMFGGWEVRIGQISREIAKRGNFRVCLIVADVGQPHIEIREGVELISWQGKSFYGIPSPINSGEKVSVESTPTNSINSGTIDIPVYYKIASKKILRVTIKKVYQSIVPWKLRTIIHGILDSLILGSRVALQHTRISVGVAMRAIGNISGLPVYPEMVEIFQEVDADIYVVPGNNQISATVAWFCKKNKRAYVMLAGSDKDFALDILSNPFGTNVYGDSNKYLLYSLRNATVHIVQNERQMKLAEGFGLKPVMIPSPIDLELKYPKATNCSQILWVGNTNNKIKQPSVMIDLIKQLPSYQFTMIITPIVEEDYICLEESTRSLTNVTMLSRVPFEEIERYFAQAKLLVNTSIVEGFPNTFLQAGKYGLPILSLNVDPNGLLTRHGCGLFCGGSMSELKEGLEKLMTDAELYARLSSNILSYVQIKHDKNRIIPEYERVFNLVLKP